jgi:putative transposase
MPRRNDSFHAGEYYHLFNRGAGQRRIFFSPENYLYCLRLLKRYCHEYGVVVVAYCLMPNHYHLLVRQDLEGSVSKLVAVVFNAYVQGVNRQRERTGTLFEGRFRHVWVDRESYLDQLCRYIHLNPVKAGLVAQPGDWPCSNYLDWVGQRAGTLIDKAFVRERFPEPEGYARFVADEMDYLRAQALVAPYVWD